MDIQIMTKESALKIMTWKYETPYDVYSIVDSEEVFEELMDGTYYEVMSEKLIGYFCYGKAAQVPPGGDLGAYDKDYIDIGLGLDPILCGSGRGKEFILNGIEYADNKFNAKGMRLTVADFNKRAIKLYKSLGFKDTMSFLRGERLFIVMELNKK